MSKHNLGGRFGDKMVSPCKESTLSCTPLLSIVLETFSNNEWVHFGLGSKKCHVT